MLWISISISAIMADAAKSSASDALPVQAAFQKLCTEYEEMIDDSLEITQPMDERIGLALFKIDEGCAAADVLRVEAEECHDQLLQALLDNCAELQEIFARIDLIERHVVRAFDLTTELERRMETVNKAASSAFSTGGVTSLLRSLSIKVRTSVIVADVEQDASRNTSDSSPADVKWAPLDTNLNVSAVMESLDKVTWRNAVVADAEWHVTDDVLRLLRHDLDDERLALLTFVGPPASRPQRHAVYEHLCSEAVNSAAPLPVGAAAIELVACVSYMEQDLRLLILDVTIDAYAADHPMAGAVGLISSLVVECERYETVPLPALRAQLQALAKEFSLIEVFDVHPSIMALDLSSRGAPSQTTAASASTASIDGVTRLKQLGSLALPSVLDTTAPLSLFAPHAPVKKIFNTELNGSILASLLRSFDDDVTAGEAIVDVGSAWDALVALKCQVVASDALSTYVDCIHASATEVPPMELDSFMSLHDDLWRLALDVYHSGAKYKSTQRRTVRHQLKSDLKTKFQEHLHELRANSRAFCSDLRTTLWQQLCQEMEASRSPATQEQPSRFATMLEAVQRFDEEYNAKARGPEKTAILLQFYREEAIQVFQRLQDVVQEEMSAEQLQGLRQRLEVEFEAKKQTLVDHFKREEEQLRLCMAREIDMMQKVHQAKSARAKMDDGEAKRMKDELLELKKQQSAWERQKIVLEQAQEDNVKQKKALEQKVEELEQSVRTEMASRAELVDTLATTVKSAEEKEKTLRAEVAELRQQVDDRSGRMETELRDLATTLKKTNEEKEELQKKLNEFFLKVTSLPESLQQHLFCLDSTGDVQFADALTSYMSA
ncbi:TPA: hypothetical protein N0F65_007372 [Lagenidium giganteum]|uniref:Guanylate-binding protein/Atlastin C-terminal domain-containing protein n=1 Tax=Lagenidium giganteum TaxID=4803 RepID=A0AAV2YII1_9STRA|nr:TPA: hypothetical protein N0F65_007372 [Lagenidium giganteum]